MEEKLKLCVRAVIPPRDLGLRRLMREYSVYKRVLIPRVKCLKCGYQTDADLVGAMNIALKALTATQMEGRLT